MFLSIDEMASFQNWFTRMTVFEFLTVLATAVTIVLVVKHYYDKKRIFKLGSKLPGPRPWPIIGNAWHFLGTKYDILTKLKRYQGKDKLLALWFGHDLHIFLYGPEFAEIFCQSSKLLDRSSKVKLLEPLAGKGAMVSNGAQWKAARKLMESALPYSAAKNFIPIIEMQGDILIERLRGEVGNPIFPIRPYLKALLFDIMSDLTIEFEKRAQKSELPLLNQVDDIMELMFNRMYNPLYHYEFLYKLLPEGKKYYSIFNSMVKFANEVIIDRIKIVEEEKKNLKSDGNSVNPKKQIFWRTLVNDKTLSVSDIRDHVFTMVVGGYDTTSATISVVLMMLAIHKDVQEKLYQEIVSIINGNFNEEKIQQLTYLDMVVKETMRLFPPIPTTFRKATEDVQMGEYLIPAGADVSVNIFELHRDPEQFPNPNVFNPDNFLPENVDRRHAYAYIPFVSGQRKCVGSKLAILITKIISAKLLLNYKFDCDYKTIEDIKFKGDLTISFPDNARVRIFERK